MGQNKRERFSRVTLTSDKHYSAYQLKKKKLQGIYILAGIMHPVVSSGTHLKQQEKEKEKKKCVR